MTSDNSRRNAGLSADKKPCEIANRHTVQTKVARQIPLLGSRLRFLIPVVHNVFDAGLSLMQRARGPWAVFVLKAAPVQPK